MGNAHVRSRLDVENRSLWRRPKGSDLGSGMPRRDEVEDSKSRGERSCLDGAVVRALLSELDIQQGDENEREDQYNGEGCSKGNHGSGHRRLLFLRV